MYIEGVPKTLKQILDKFSFIAEFVLLYHVNGSRVWEKIKRKMNNSCHESANVHQEKKWVSKCSPRNKEQEKQRGKRWKFQNCLPTYSTSLFYLIKHKAETETWFEISKMCSYCIQNKCISFLILASTYTILKVGIIHLCNLPEIYGSLFFAC